MAVAEAKVCDKFDEASENRFEKVLDHHQASEEEEAVHSQH